MANHCTSIASSSRILEIDDGLRPHPIHYYPRFSDLARFRHGFRRVLLETASGVEAWGDDACYISGQCQ